MSNIAKISEIMKSDIPLKDKVKILLKKKNENGKGQF